MGNVGRPSEDRTNTEVRAKYSNEGNIILDMMSEKGVSQAEMARRGDFGYTATFRNALLAGKSMTVDSLKRICDVLGVELCIMDGFKKYRLSGKAWNPDTDLILGRLAEEEDRSIDKVKELEDHKAERHREQEAKRRESDREGYNTYMREYRQKKRAEKPIMEVGNVCFNCEHYEKTIKKNGKGYCTKRDQFTCKDYCNDFGRADDNSPTEGEKMP